MGEPSRIRRRKVLPFSRLFPNIVTIGGMCCGLSSIRFALDSKFEIAVALLVAAAIIDGMDGRLARFFNSTSDFGAQLDSLSDFVSFGVCPVFVLYLWKLHELKPLGWALVLLFVVCCALRLARFNTNLAQENVAPWQNKFFTGIPSPAGAMLCLLPLVTSFFAPTNIIDTPIACAIWVPIIAILMASRVPTFAAKKLRIHHEWVLPIMLVCCVTIVLVIMSPWEMFTVCALMYCATIPLSIKHYRKMRAAHDAGVTPTLFSMPE